MKTVRIAGCTLLVLALAATAAAQDWAKQTLAKSPRHGEWVQLKNGDRNVSAFVVYPEVKGKAPAVVVIHEIFGMTDWVQTVADQLAADGYIAIAPALLSGTASNGKIAVAGFCWGGSQSFRFATNRADLKAAFVFYGTAPDSGLEKIAAPVYG